MNTFKSIPTVGSSISCATYADNLDAALDINSSAKHIVRDINYIAPQMILPDTSIDDALTIMQRSSNKSSLYIGSDNKLLGVLSHLTLMSRKILMIVNRKGITRSELTVADVMTLAYRMPAVSKEHIERARIGNVKQTMLQLGEEHIQVVDENHRICGVISATDISKVLHITVDINATAHSFRDCFDVIHQHAELI